MSIVQEYEDYCKRKDESRKRERSKATAFVVTFGLLIAVAGSALMLSMSRYEDVLFVAVGCAFVLLSLALLSNIWIDRIE